MNFHFFLIVTPAKKVPFIAGTLDKSVGGGSNAGHQRDVAWAGGAVTVIPVKGTSSEASRAESRFKRNWCHFTQPYYFLSTFYLFLIAPCTSPGLFILLASFSALKML